MSGKTLQIRMAGESGEGVLSTGELVTLAAARAGFQVLTFKTNPAEIKGGHALFQVRLSRERLWEVQDEVDILLAFNQEAYDKNYQHLREGGLLVYDAASFTPPEEGDRFHYPIPMADIARNQIRFGLAKNVVGVGALAGLFGLDREVLERLLEQKFLRKGREVLEKNLQALEAGMAWVAQHPAGADFSLEPGKRDPTQLVATGNQALGMGAIAAGCRLYYGYPITPATDVMEFLAAELPRVGGHVLQVEDEMAALGMVIGASYAGARAMTATSGPGFSLMVEMLGLAAMAEIPCVVADIQRGGPSTGLPTKHEQSDLYLAALGGHGEIQRIVLAPISVEDCFYQAVHAFNLAEQFQLPVILLSDTVLATRITNFPRPDLSRLPRVSRKLYPGDGSSNGDPDGRYMRYRLTEDGVSPMSLPGTPGGQYVATGLEHNELGRPRGDAVTHMRMTRKRFQKMQQASRHAPEPFRYGPAAADLGVITWGSTTGTVAQAVDVLAERGVQVEVLAPRMLWPLPEAQLAEFMDRKACLVVVECNYSGQFANLISTRFPRPMRRINTYGGAPFKTAELVGALEELYEYAH